MALNGNVLKNLGKSLAYTAVDVTNEYMPNTTDLIRTARTGVDEARNYARTNMSKIRTATGNLNKTSVARQARVFLEDTLKDIREGNFALGDIHNKLDSELAEIESELSSWDSSFGDADSLSQALGGANADVEGSGEAGDFPSDSSHGIDLTAIEVSARGHLATVDALSELQNTLGNAQVRTSEYVTERITQSLFTQMAQTSTQFTFLAKQLQTINENLVSINEYNRDVGATSAQTALAFYDTVSDYIKFQEKRATKAAEVSKENEPSIVQRFMGDKYVDAQKYAEIVKENLKSSEIGYTMQNLTSGIDTLMSLVQGGSAGGMKIQPQKLLIKGLLSAILPKQARRQLGQTDELAGTIFKYGLEKLGSYRYSMTDHPILGALGSIFGIDNRAMRTIKMGDFKKGEMTWNGEAQRVLTTVIPKELAEIKAAILGTEAQYYDMQTGKYMTKDEVKARTQVRFQDAIESPFANIFNKISFDANDIADKAIWMAMDDDTKAQLSKAISNAILHPEQDTTATRTQMDALFRSTALNLDEETLRKFGLERAATDADVSRMMTELLQGVQTARARTTDIIRQLQEETAAFGQVMSDSEFINEFGNISFSNLTNDYLQNQGVNLKQATDADSSIYSQSGRRYDMMDEGLAARLQEQDAVVKMLVERVMNATGPDAEGNTSLGKRLVRQALTGGQWRHDTMAGNVINDTMDQIYKLFMLDQGGQITQGRNLMGVLGSARDAIRNTGTRIGNRILGRQTEETAPVEEGPIIPDLTDTEAPPEVPPIPSPIPAPIPTVEEETPTEERTLSPIGGVPSGFMGIIGKLDDGFVFLDSIDSGIKTIIDILRTIIPGQGPTPPIPPAPPPFIPPMPPMPEVPPERQPPTQEIPPIPAPLADQSIIQQKLTEEPTPEQGPAPAPQPIVVEDTRTGSLISNTMDRLYQLFTDTQDIRDAQWQNIVGLLGSVKNSIKDVGAQIGSQILEHLPQPAPAPEVAPEPEPAPEPVEEAAPAPEAPEAPPAPAPETPTVEVVLPEPAPPPPSPVLERIQGEAEKITSRLAGGFTNLIDKFDGDTNYLSSIDNGIKQIIDILRAKSGEEPEAPPVVPPAPTPIIPGPIELPREEEEVEPISPIPAEPIPTPPIPGPVPIPAPVIGPEPVEEPEPISPVPVEPPPAPPIPGPVPIPAPVIGPEPEGVPEPISPVPAPEPEPISPVPAEPLPIPGEPTPAEPAPIPAPALGEPPIAPMPEGAPPPIPQSVIEQSLFRQVMGDETNQSQRGLSELDSLTPSGGPIDNIKEQLGGNADEVYGDESAPEEPKLTPASSAMDEVERESTPGPSGASTSASQDNEPASVDANAFRNATEETPEAEIADEVGEQHKMFQHWFDPENGVFAGMFGDKATQARERFMKSPVGKIISDISGKIGAEVKDLAMNDQYDEDGNLIAKGALNQVKDFFGQAIKTTRDTIMGNVEFGDDVKADAENFSRLRNEYNTIQGMLRRKDLEEGEEAHFDQREISAVGFTRDFLDERENSLKDQLREIDDKRFYHSWENMTDEEVMNLRKHLQGNQGILQSKVDEGTASAEDTAKLGYITQRLDVIDKMMREMPEKLSEEEQTALDTKVEELKKSLQEVKDTKKTVSTGMGIDDYNDMDPNSDEFKQYQAMAKEFRKAHPEAFKEGLDSEKRDELLEQKKSLEERMAAARRYNFQTKFSAGAINTKIDNAIDYLSGGPGEKIRASGGEVSEQILAELNAKYQAMPTRGRKADPELRKELEDKMRRLGIARGYAQAIDEGGNKEDILAAERAKMEELKQQYDLYKDDDSKAAEFKATKSKMRAQRERINVAKEVDDNGMLEEYRDRYQQALDEQIEAIRGQGSAQQQKGLILGDLAKHAKANFPKYMKSGIISALGLGAIKALAGGNVGLLASAFLPGNIIGAAVAGTAFSFLNRNGTVMDALLGKKDEDGKRLGGIITKESQEKFKKAIPTILGGSAAGIGIGAIMGKIYSALPIPGGSILGKVGAFAGNFLPGGPLGAAVLGSAAAFALKNEQVQDILFGKVDKDTGERKGAFLSKMYNKFTGKMKTSDGDHTSLSDKIKQAFGGAGVGMASGVMLKNMGLLGSLMGPHGAIGMAALGAALSIGGAGQKFADFLLGKKGKDGNYDGNGLLSRINRLVQVNLIEPATDYFKETSVQFAWWLKEKVEIPFRMAFGPVIDSFKDAGKTVKDGVTNIIKKIAKTVDNWLFKPVTEIILKPIGKLGLKMLGGAVRGGLNLTASALGAPFKIASLLTSPIRRKQEKQFRKSIRGRQNQKEIWEKYKQTRTQEAKENGEKYGLGAKAVDRTNLFMAQIPILGGLFRNTDVVADGAGEHYEDKYGKNTLGWVSARRDLKQYKKEAKEARRQFKREREQKKLRRKYVNADKGDERKVMDDINGWSDDEFKQRKKELADKGVKIKNRRDMQNYLYHYEDWKENKEKLERQKQDQKKMQYLEEQVRSGEATTKQKKELRKMKSGIDEEREDLEKKHAAGRLSPDEKKRLKQLRKSKKAEISDLESRVKEGTATKEDQRRLAKLKQGDGTQQDAIKNLQESQTAEHKETMGLMDKIHEVLGTISDTLLGVKDNTESTAEASQRSADVGEAQLDLQTGSHFDTDSANGDLSEAIDESMAQDILEDQQETAAKKQGGILGSLMDKAARNKKREDAHADVTGNDSGGDFDDLDDDYDIDDEEEEEGSGDDGGGGGGDFLSNVLAQGVGGVLKALAGPAIVALVGTLLANEDVREMLGKAVGSVFDKAAELSGKAVNWIVTEGPGWVAEKAGKLLETAKDTVLQTLGLQDNEEKERTYVDAEGNEHVQANLDLLEHAGGLLLNPAGAFKGAVSLAKGVGRTVMDFAKNKATGKKFALTRAVGGNIAQGAKGLATSAVTKAKTFLTNAGEDVNGVIEHFTGKRLWGGNNAASNVASKVLTNADDAMDVAGAVLNNADDVASVGNKVAGAAGKIIDNVDDVTGAAANAAKIVDKADDVAGAASTVGKVLDKVDDVAASAGGAASKIASEVLETAERIDADDVGDALSWLEKALQSAAKSKLGKAFAKIGEVCKSITEFFATLKSKIANKVFGNLADKLSKALVEVGVKSASNLTPMVLLNATIAIGAAVDGAMYPERLFDINKDQVDGTMRTISAIFSALFSVSGAASLVEVVSQIVDMAIGVNFVREIAKNLYIFIKNASGDSDAAARIKEAEDLFQQEVDNYNEANGTNISRSAYADMKNKKWYEKAGGAIVNFFTGKKDQDLSQYEVGNYKGPNSQTTGQGTGDATGYGEGEDEVQIGNFPDGQPFKLTTDPRLMTGADLSALEEPTTDTDATGYGLFGDAINKAKQVASNLWAGVSQTTFIRNALSMIVEKLGNIEKSTAGDSLRGKITGAISSGISSIKNKFKEIKASRGFGPVEEAAPASTSITNGTSISARQREMQGLTPEAAKLWPNVSQNVFLRNIAAMMVQELSALRTTVAATSPVAAVVNTVQNVKTQASSIFNNLTSKVRSVVGGKIAGYGAGDTQNDPRWADKAIGTFPSGRTATMETAGCGPTALSNAAKMLGVKTDPSSMADFAINNGYISDGGANDALFDKGANKFGLNTERVQDPASIIANLQSGNPVIMAGKSNEHGPYTEAGHIITATGIDESGNVTVSDPRTPGTRTFPLRTLQTNMTSGWAVDKGEPEGYGPGTSDKKPTGYGIFDTILGGAVSGIGTAALEMLGQKYFKGKDYFTSNSASDSGTEGSGGTGGSSGGSSGSSGSSNDQYYDPNRDYSSGYTISGSGTLGEISAKFESNGKPGTISSGTGDPGGPSFGMFQFPSYWNETAQKDTPLWRFWNNYGYAQKHPGVNPGNNEPFKSAWKAEAESDPEKFGRDQMNMAANEYYKVARDKLVKDIGFDPDKHSRAAQELVMSTAIQWGPASGAKVIKNALSNYASGKDPASMTAEEFVNVVSDWKRDGVDGNFPSSSQQVKNSIRNRFDVSERNALLAIADQGPLGYGSVDPKKANKKATGYGIFDTILGGAISDIGNAALGQLSKKYFNGLDFSSSSSGSDNGGSGGYDGGYSGGSGSSTGVTGSYTGGNGIKMNVEWMKNGGGVEYPVVSYDDKSVLPGQAAVVNAMASKYHQVEYSLNKAQNVAKNVGSCASTVAYGYEAGIGKGGMSASSSGQSKDGDFTTIWENRDGRPVDESILQPGDVMYINWNQTRFGGANSEIKHTEMYAGGGKNLNHGGSPKYGPEFKDLGYRAKNVMMVRRYTPFIQAQEQAAQEQAARDNAAKREQTTAALLDKGVDWSKIGQMPDITTRPGLGVGEGDDSAVGYGAGDELNPFSRKAEAEKDVQKRSGFKMVSQGNHEFRKFSDGSKATSPEGYGFADISPYGDMPEEESSGFDLNSVGQYTADESETTSGYGPGTTVATDTAKIETRMDRMIDILETIANNGKEQLKAKPHDPKQTITVNYGPGDDKKQGVQPIIIQEKKEQPGGKDMKFNYLRDLHKKIASVDTYDM